MSDMSRRAFLAVAASSALAMVGCSSGGGGVSRTAPEDEQDDDMGAGSFEGMAYLLPDGWEEDEGESVMILSRGYANVQISAPDEYSDSTSEESIARAVFETIAPDTTSHGELRETDLNGRTCYRFDFEDESIEDGQMLLVFSRDRYWMVLAGNFGGMADSESMGEMDMILNSISVI